jgi:hypothetical protein
MSKVDKREQKIRGNTKNVSLADFEALINQYGYIKFGGSHVKAIIGNVMFPYKRTNPVKPPYVEGILEIIDKQK